MTYQRCNTQPCTWIAVTATCAWPPSEFSIFSLCLLMFCFHPHPLRLWTSHVTWMNTSLIWMRHVTYLSHDTYSNESRCMHERVMSQEWSADSSMLLTLAPTESCHICELVTSQIWMIHVTTVVSRQQHAINTRRRSSNGFVGLGRAAGRISQKDFLKVSSISVLFSKIGSVLTYENFCLPRADDHPTAIYVYRYVYRCIHMYGSGTCGR